MWQRVQTLYLFLSTALVGSMFFCDKAEGVGFLTYLPYVVFLVIASALNLLALTTWKFRIFQVRTTVLTALVTFFLQLLIALDFYLNHNDYSFRLPAVFPAVAVILDILAARGIWADELMVRSSSRLRAAKRKRK